MVHGAGRTPALDSLNLGAGGVERDAHGVVVNEFFQSVSNEKVYAAGDVTLQKGGYPLTPVAHYEGDIAADNMLHGNSKTADYTGIPSVAFTVPAIAMVGMKEEEAAEAGYVFSVHTGDTADWYSSRRVQEPHAMYKTLVDDETGLILGAHLIGPHVEDTINLFALAIRQGITVEKFKAMMWAYPTHASDTGYML